MHKTMRAPRTRPLRALGFLLLLTPGADAIAAEIQLPPITVGAAMRSSFTSTDLDGAPEDINDFTLDSARVFLTGKATENIDVIFLTEYDSLDEEIRVIDLAARFSFSDQLNIWAGRFLPPSDRANLYGNYYANHWGSFIDGVQDGYPSETTGRNDGVMYLGQFGNIQVSAGAFDFAGRTTGDSDVLYAGRVQVDFGDLQPGHFQSGTYYGDKNVISLGLATQSVAGDSAYSIDFLYERKLPASGVVSLEAQYAMYDGLGGYPSPNTFLSYDESDGYYVLGGYLFPQPVGIGRFQIVAKYGETTYDYLPGVFDIDQTTSEVDLSYIIKGSNARISLFYIDVDFSPTAVQVTPDRTQIGIGLQVQI
jgi:hypothetical protein